MSLEQENWDKVLEKHEDRIEEIDNKVQELEVALGRVDERLKNVEVGQVEIKSLIQQSTNQSLQSSNQLLTLLTQVLNNQNQKEINITNNKNDLYKKIVAGIFSVLTAVGGYIFGKTS